MRANTIQQQVEKRECIVAQHRKQQVLIRLNPHKCFNIVDSALIFIEKQCTLSSSKALPHAYHRLYMHFSSVFSSVRWLSCTHSIPLPRFYSSYSEFSFI